MDSLYKLPKHALQSQNWRRSRWRMQSNKGIYLPTKRSQKPEENSFQDSTKQRLERGFTTSRMGISIEESNQYSIAVANFSNKRLLKLETPNKSTPGGIS